MKTIDIIAGARPNFVKVSAVIDALRTNPATEKFDVRFLHTGQHIDNQMSSIFLKQLGIGAPSITLSLEKNLSSNAQTAAIIKEYDAILQRTPSDLCLTFGDVNSTIACSIAAKRHGIILGHVEAGIRSFDRTMPEEINRIVTDSISDLFFTTSKFANDNLLREGADPKKIHFVGNTMVDTLMAYRHLFKPPSIWKKLLLEPKKYMLLTLHRPDNVDNKDRLYEVLERITSTSDELKIVFPVHPRTAKQFPQDSKFAHNLIITEPLGYFEFGFLAQNAMVIVTDSGGLSEEATIYGVPCLTVRDNTERPETIELGTNELIGRDLSGLTPMMELVLTSAWKKHTVPDKWDGKTGTRIAEIILGAV